MPRKTHRRKHSRRDENKMEEEDKASLSSRKSTHTRGPSQVEPTQEKRHDGQPIHQTETASPQHSERHSSPIPIPASTHVVPPPTRTLADGVAPSPTSPAMPIGSPREYVSPSIMLDSQPLLVPDEPHGPVREAAFEALDAAIASARSATLVSTPLTAVPSDDTVARTERHLLRANAGGPVDVGRPVTAAALARDAWSGGHAGAGTAADSSAWATGSAALLHALRALPLHARPHGEPFHLQRAGARALRGVRPQSQVRLEPARAQEASSARGAYTHARVRRHTQAARRAWSSRGGVSAGVWRAHAQPNPLTRLMALAPPPVLPPLPALRTRAARTHAATAAAPLQPIASLPPAAAEAEGAVAATHRGEGSPVHAPAHSPRRDALMEEAYGAPQSDAWAASVGQRLHRVLSRETRMDDTLAPPSDEQAAAGMALPASEADACVYVRSPRLASEPNYLASAELVTAPTLAADALARVQRMLAGDASVDSEAVPAEGLTDAAHGAGACACGATCAFGLGEGGPGWLQPGTWTGSGLTRWGAATGTPLEQLLDAPQALACVRCRRNTLGALGRAAVGARRFLCEESDEVAGEAATRRSRSRAAQAVADVDWRWREKLRAQRETLEDGAEAADASAAERRQRVRGAQSPRARPMASADREPQSVGDRLEASRMVPSASSAPASSPQPAQPVTTQARAALTGPQPTGVAEDADARAGADAGTRVRATGTARGHTLQSSSQPASNPSTRTSTTPPPEHSTAARAMAARAARAATPATGANTTATAATDSAPGRAAQGQSNGRTAGSTRPMLQSAADVAPPGASGAGVQPQEEFPCSYGWGLPQFVSVDVVRALAEVARRTGAAASTVDAILSRARFPYPNYRIAPYQSWPQHVPLRTRPFAELFPHADTWTGYRPSSDVTDQPSLPAPTHTPTPAPPPAARTPATLNTRIHTAAAAASPPLPPSVPATAAPAAAAAATTAQAVAALRGRGPASTESHAAPAASSRQPDARTQASLAGTRPTGTSIRRDTSRSRRQRRRPLWLQLASRLPPLPLLPPLQRLQRHLHWPQGHPHAPASAAQSRHHGAPQSQYSPPLSAIDDLYSDRRPAAPAAGGAARTPAPATTFAPLPAREAAQLPADHARGTVPPPPPRSRLGLLPGVAASGVDMRPAGPLPAAVVSTARVSMPTRVEAAVTPPVEPQADMWVGEGIGPEHGGGHGRRGQRDERKEEKDDQDEDEDAARKLPPKRAPGAGAPTRTRSRDRRSPGDATATADAGTNTLAMPSATQADAQVAVNTAFPPTMTQPLLPRRRDGMARTRARERLRVADETARQTPASSDVRARTTPASSRPNAAAAEPARGSLEDYLALHRPWPRYSLPARLLACRHASPRDYDTPADAPIAPGATVASRARALAAFLVARLQRLRAGIVAGLPLHDAVQRAARNSAVCTVCRQASSTRTEQQSSTVAAPAESGGAGVTSSHVPTEAASISGVPSPETPFSPAFVADFAAEPVQTTTWAPTLQRPSARATVRDPVSGPLLGLAPEPPEAPSPAECESTADDELALLVGDGAKSAQMVEGEMSREEAEEGEDASTGAVGHDLRVRIRGARDVRARLAQAGSVLEREKAEAGTGERGLGEPPLGYAPVPQTQVRAGAQSPPATVVDAEHEEEAEEAPDDQWALASGYHVYGAEAGEDGVAEEQRAREREAALAARAAQEAEEQREHIRLLSAEDRDDGETARGWRGKGHKGERDEEKNERRTAR